MEITDKEWFRLHPEQVSYYREPTDQERLAAAQAGHPGLNLMWVLLDGGDIFRVQVLNSFSDQHLLKAEDRKPIGIPALDLLVKVRDS